MKKRVLSFLLVIVIVFSFAPAASAASSAAISSATNLYTLGLFKGTGTNADGTPIYELDRAPTRAEAVVMLVRLLGKEKEAKGGSYSHPFSDVYDWAAPYVAYAYSKGLSNGTGNTTYGSGDTISASQFITLVLRALGYTSGKDFKWDTSYEFSDSIGLTDGSYKADSDFKRGDAAVVLFCALSQKLNGSNQTLLDYLYKNGTVTAEAVKSVGLSSLLDASSSDELTAEQIYLKCSPAVFYITVYDSAGTARIFNSGFFIDSNGTAVIGYETIKNAYSAKVKTTDGKQYNVLGIYSIDKTNDLAIIKVDGSGFKYLEMGDSDTVKTGATVYAIGTPQGFENTMTQGIVSYPNRVINGVSYIQTSASFSPGIYGGALIDKYGKVIGVAAGSYENGQNLNVAIPINRVKPLQHTSYTQLGKFSAGTEKAYSCSSVVPDFGIYIGVPIYSSTNSISKTNSHYYYNKYKLSDVTSINPNALAEYASLLRKWGFSYARGYESSSGDIDGDIYVQGNIEVLVAIYTASDGTEYAYIVVNIHSSYETGYSNNTSVPDFGAYFGVIYQIGRVNGNYRFYYYNRADVDFVSSAALSDYRSLLVEWGFKYTSEYNPSNNASKITGTTYQKGTVSVNVCTGYYTDTNNPFVLIRIYDSAGENDYPAKEVGYSYNSLVPDFGAYYGISTYKDLSNNGAYTILYKKSDATSRDTYAVDDYCSLLEDWGFKYIKKCTGSMQGAYYTKGNNTVLIGTVSRYDTDCIIIEFYSSALSSSYPKKEVGYPFNPTVPDFGIYFGTFIKTADPYIDNVSKISFYYYEMPDVTSKESNALAEYAALLRKWSFSYEKEYNSGSISGELFLNGNVHIIVATKTYSDGTAAAYISIMQVNTYNSTYPQTETGYSNNTSVPDFGSYIGVNVYKDLSDDVVCTYLYKSADVSAKDTFAASDYCSLLIKRGFRFNKTLSNDLLYGSYYVNGNITAFVGTYTYNDTLCVIVRFNKAQ